MTETDAHALTVESSRSAEGIDLVALHGELDFSSSEPLSSAFAALSGGRRRVVVDLAGMTFVDSSGVKMIVAAARAVEEAGGVFVLAAPNSSVRRVFEILHLDEIVTVADDLRGALERASRLEEDGAAAEGDA